MKFAFVLRMYQEKKFHGGGEKLFFNLIQRLQRDGHAVDVYCSYSDTIADNITLIKARYDHNKPESMERFYNEARRFIAQKDYDYVISENITPPIGITFLQGHSLLNRLRKNKNPLEAFLYNFRKTKKQRLKYQEKWIKQGYQKIFAVSEILKQDIVDNFGVSPDNIAVVHPGVDLPEGENFEVATDIAKTPHQVRGDNVLVRGDNVLVRGDNVLVRSDNVLVRSDKVFFGLLAPGFNIKGGYVFLKALALLKKKGYDFCAKIVYPKYKKNLGLKLLIKFYGIEKNVEFLDYQRDMTKFYSSIDCLVAPSLEDTFNLAALEAMAHCRPVIVSNYAGACEIINEGENGFVFDISHKGAANLAEKLEYYLVHKCILQENLSQNTLRTAEVYDWDRFYEIFIENLRNLPGCDFALN